MIFIEKDGKFKTQNKDSASDELPSYEGDEEKRVVFLYNFLNKKECMFNLAFFQY